MADMSGLGIGMAGFAKGLQDSLALVGRQRQIAAQEEHIKHQTQLLKAQKLLTEEAAKRKAQEAADGAKLYEAILGKEIQVPWSGDYGADVSMPQAPQTATVRGPQDLRTAVAIAARLNPAKFGEHIFDQAFPKPSEQKPMIVGPGQTLVGPQGQPMYSSPPAEKPQQTYRVDTGVEIQVRDAATHAVIERIPKQRMEQKEKSPAEATVGEMEEAASKKAMPQPWNLADPGERAQFTQQAYQHGSLSAKDVLEKTPVEREPLNPRWVNYRKIVEEMQAQSKTTSEINAKLNELDAGRGASVASAETTAREKAKLDYLRLPAEASNRYALYKQVEKDVNRIEELFAPKFVGKGFQSAQGFAPLKKAFSGFEGDARTGKYQAGALFGAIREWVGSAPPEEVEFRQAVADAANTILYARSGAQINEGEFVRLKGALFSLWDEPTVFLTRLRAVRGIVNNNITSILEAAATPVKDIQQKRAGKPATGGLNFPPPSDVKMIGVHELSDGSRAYWDGKQWLNRKP